jgi:uncharacterized protein YcbK (DUF882 family)
MTEHYFDNAEFLCRCRRQECDALRTPNRLLVEVLDAVREHLNRPLTVTSGLRCEFWNRHEGGAKNSEHLTGHAADLAVVTGVDRWEIVQAAMAAGITRIGVAGRFIHLGVSQTLAAPVIWTYDAPKPKGGTQV